MAIPVDFNTIGIKLKLDPAALEYTKEVKIANDMFQTAKDIPNNILPKNYSKDTLMSYDIDISNLQIIKTTTNSDPTYNFLADRDDTPSFLIINGENYYITTNTIKPGVSAIVNEVINQDGGTRYILKTSIDPNNTYDNTYEIAIKEAMINHTLWTHNNECTNKIICVASMKIDNKFFVFVIQEKLDQTLMSLIVAPKPEEKFLVKYKVLLVLNEIITILKSLWKLDTLEFNHCDLKPDNIMIHNKKFKLIDFGLSNLKNQKYICKTPDYDDYNSNRNASKDLSALIWYILNYGNIVFDANVEKFFKDCLRIDNIDLNADTANWSNLLRNVNENYNNKTDITTFKLPEYALTEATLKMSGIQGGNRRKRITRRTNKKLSKKLTKKDRKSKMKGGRVPVAVKYNLTPTNKLYESRSNFAARSESRLQSIIDLDTVAYLSTYSVEHLITYLRFNKSIDDKDALVQYLTGKLTYTGIERTPNSVIHKNKNAYEMIDLFMTQTEPNDALRLLRVLLQFPIYDNDMTYYNNYISKFKTITDERIKNSYLNLTFPSEIDLIF